MIKTIAMGLSAASFALLTACGGGGAAVVDVDGNVTFNFASQAPLSTTGYATSGDSIVQGTEFGAQLVRILQGALNGELVDLDLTNAEIAFTIKNTEPSEVVITIDGKAFTLTFFEEAEGFLGSIGDTVIFVEREIAVSNVVDVIYWEVVNTGVEGEGDGISSGYLAFGFNTDPETIEALTGAATYSGLASADFVFENRNYLYVTGTFTLDADFGDDTVSGEINLLSGTNEINVTMEETDIDGNAFAGDIAIDIPSYEGSDDIDYSEAGYYGQFYGADGEAVGGGFYAAGTDDGEEFAVIGGFAGTSDSDAP